MSEMDRERFEDLKEAYALGALSDAERREFEGYLSLHPELRPEVEELGSIANMLAHAPAEYEPSPSIRRSLMDIVNAEAEEEQAEQAPALSRWRGYFSFPSVAAAALTIVAVALLGWNVLLQGEIQDLQGELQEQQTFAMQGSGAASDVSAQVIEMKDGRAIVMAENMPPMPPDKTMQIWVIRDGTPRPAGTFRPSGDTAAAPIAEPLRDAEAVAITVEPAGGSEKPTSDPVLETRLRT